MFGARPSARRCHTGPGDRRPGIRHPLRSAAPASVRPRNGPGAVGGGARQRGSAHPDGMGLSCPGAARRHHRCPRRHRHRGRDRRPRVAGPLARERIDVRHRGHRHRPPGACLSRGTARRACAIWRSAWTIPRTSWPRSGNEARYCSLVNVRRRLRTAWPMRCSFSMSANRTWPSPPGPKPTPGDVATSASDTRNEENSSDPISR